MAKTLDQLEAENKKLADKIDKLTKAHETIVKDNQAKIEELEKEKAELAKKAEQAKAEAKRKREAAAEEAKKTMREKIKNAPHQWVKVFDTGLTDGVDFAFTFEGLLFRLLSGEPVCLSEILINHLKGCGYPKIKLKQGEAGTPIKVTVFHHRFNVVNCEPPEDKKAVG